MVFFLLAVFFIQGGYSIISQSATFDEQIHLVSGYYYWKTGDYSLNALEHPPLAELLASIPLLFLNPLLPCEETGWRGGTQYDYAFNFLFRNRVDAALMLDSARMVLLFFGVLLGYLVYFWAGKIYGGSAGLFSLFLYSFCPSMLANAPLVTTDLMVAFFFLLSAYFMLELFREYSPGSALAAGVITGMALSAKFSSVILLPAAVLLAAAELLRAPGKFSLRKTLPGTALFLGGMLLTLLAVYRFVEIQYYFAGMKQVFRKVYSSSGFEYFLMGKYSGKGWWYYFIANFMMKTPVPLIIFLFAGIWVSAVSRKRAYPGLYIVAAAALFFTAASFSRFQIGHRHILPVYPLLIVSAGGILKYLSGKKVKAIFVLLCLWYAIGVLATAPYYISYFNEVFGGASNGYKYLVDSNLDWGQGLKGLGKYLLEEKKGGIYLSYFGTADPAYYGIDYLPVGFVTNAGCLAQGGRKTGGSGYPGLFVISATNLQGAYYQNHLAFDWLKEMAPVKVIANSLFVYDIINNAQAHREIGDLLLGAGDSEGGRREYGIADSIAGKKTR